MTSTMEQRACPAICAISTTPIFLCMGTGIGDYLVAGRQSAAELDTLYGHGNHLLAVCFRTKSRHCLSHVKHLLSPPQYYHRGGERTRARQRPGHFGKGGSHADDPARSSRSCMRDRLAEESAGSVEHPVLHHVGGTSRA